MRRFLVKATFFVVVLVALGAAMRGADTLDDVAVVGPKLRYFADHKDDFDTIFVGSSYVYRELSPAVVDGVTSSRDAPTRSFNFGVPGMDPPETYALVERILEMQPASLRTVVLELDYYREKVRPRDVHTRRFDYWHDAATTAEVARAILESDASRGKKLKDFASHAEALVRRFFAVGRGPAMLGAHRAAADALGLREDGFRSLDSEESGGFALRRGLFEAVEGDLLDEKVGALRASPGIDARSDGVGSVDREALARAVERIRQQGARAVLIVPPCLAPRGDLIRMATEEIGVDVLVFNSPESFPTLYEAEMRFDVGHLNERGAIELSRLLGERL